MRGFHPQVAFCVIKTGKQALGESRAEAGEELVAITSVLGLLALLIAFTFAIALDRFDTRRANVLQELERNRDNLFARPIGRGAASRPDQQFAGRLYRYAGCTRDGSAWFGATCAVEEERPADRRPVDGDRRGVSFNPRLRCFQFVFELS